MVLQPSGAPLNMCSWDSLIQMLRFLKRAFWPAAWDFEDSNKAVPGGWAGGSGFVGAAQVGGIQHIKCRVWNLHICMDSTRDTEVLTPRWGHDLGCGAGCEQGRGCR